VLPDRSSPDKDAVDDLLPIDETPSSGCATFFLTFTTYIVSSFILFGGPLKPLWLMFFFGDRLAAPYWPLLVIVAFTLAALIVWRKFWRSEWLYSLYIAAAMFGSVFLVGVYAETLRWIETGRFEPDEHFESSFFGSVRNAPREFNPFMHGAALKDCKAYLWSYREMGFVEMTPGRGNNNLPHNWHQQCPGLLKMPEL